MMANAKPSQNLLEEIRRIVGPKGWISDGADIEPYLVEERGRFHGTCAMVVRPDATEQMAEAVRLCARDKVAMTPQGGNTGLVGGGVPDGGIVLSTERLQSIRDINPFDMTMTVETGCVLASVQQAAREKNRLFPLSLGAEGSCRIGGVLSTNAGGVSVLRYGAMRDLVLGLEVVLPDGQIWNGLRHLRKDNTGYDLKHLFIGAEGTLGVITAAVLKLFPLQTETTDALVAASTLKPIMELFLRIRETSPDALDAFEVFSEQCMAFSIKHTDRQNPFSESHRQYALIRLCSNDASLRQSLENTLATALDDGLIENAVIAASETQSQNLWHLREAIPEAQKREGASIKHDVSLPLSKTADFIEKASAMVEREMPGVRVIAFGHLGDGNVHFNLSQPETMDSKAFLDHWEHFNTLVHDLAVDMGGSFSAEHGIGQLKLDHMKRYKSGVELDLMKRIKQTLDPENIMNPGKVIPETKDS
jgi:FAD/FMN-containing dehydrogenase